MGWMNGSHILEMFMHLKQPLPQQLYRSLWGPGAPHKDENDPDSAFTQLHHPVEV